jgi:hypothetical protein
MYDEISQLQTRIAILESQIDVRDVTIAKLKTDIERLTNLVGTLINKDKWDGSDIEPTLEYKLLDPDEKETR